MSDIKEMIVYHAAPIMLGEGGIILPGNWGRMLKRYTDVSAVLLRESILESVRALRFPEKPSRMTSLFAIESLDAAIAYRDSNCPHNLIYELIVDDSDLTIHRGDYSFSMPPGQYLLDGLHQMAEMYWSEQPAEFVELVIPGPGKVMRVVG
ncbi:DUF2441 domain-containing protein [Pseudomonas juntendi]|uniref:DUF2441 domain-containing protein n=1 Tax=Pseudomonas juntendi TaxID=2666183 RepID=UPI003453DE12